MGMLEKYFMSIVLSFFKDEIFFIGLALGLPKRGPEICKQA
jgi:hypothetical protein